MARSDALALVSKLSAVFRSELSDSAVEAYVDALEAVDPKVLASAANRAITRSKFFPSVAEILEACLAASGMLPPSAAEIAAVTRRADKREPELRRDGSWTGDYRMTWEWPEDASPLAIRLAQETLAKVGEPCDPKSKDYFGWEMGFVKTYETIAAEAKQEALQNVSQLRLPAPKMRRLEEVAKAAAKGEQP